MVRFWILLLTLLLTSPFVWANDLSEQAQECPNQTNENSLQQLADYGGIYVFVSFSMPIQSLQQWATQVKKVGGVLVLRGLKNNSLKDTLNQAKRVFGEENVSNFIIDPTAFDRFNILSVPAVLVTEKPISPCNKVDCEVSPHDVIFGDVGLHYALKKISENADLSSYAEKYLKMLESA